MDFFEPTIDLLATAPVGDVLARLTLTPPRTVDLGTFRVVVDDTNACDDHAPAETVAIYRGQLLTALGGPGGEATIWILTHRPFWGLKQLDPTADINHTMQAALAAAALKSRGPPPSVRLLVAGHMHLFQSLTFEASPSGEEVRPRRSWSSGTVASRPATAPERDRRRLPSMDGRRRCCPRRNTAS